MSTKIVELFINDDYDESGIDAISLVSHPATEENWLAFNKQKLSEPDEEFNPYTIVDEDFCSHNPKLYELGEDYNTLIDEGWEIVKVEKITPQVVHQMREERFGLLKFSNPNEDSVLDRPEERIRFKYVGPNDEKTRRFCKDMLQIKKVYRAEDIDELSNSGANEQFGSYNIFLWRGSFNCRHTWVRLIYRKTGRILNTTTVRTGVIKEQGLGPDLQPDTRTTTTINSPNKKKQWHPGQPRVGGTFCKTKMDIEPNPCWEGYEPIGLKDDGSPNCVPIKMVEDFAESIKDYPEGVKNAAKKVLNYVEKNGWGSCGTDVGKQRANQLAKGEAISVDTVKRMYSYLSRHKSDLTSSKSYDDGCGKLMYDSWGGEAALKWAERKVQQFDKQKMVFGFDEEKQVIVGAAMVPNKMIHRYDDMGNLYYVFFSRESIKKMADKFLRQRRTDDTSIEHNGVKLGADKVYINESWVSEDSILDKSHAFGFELPSGTWFVSMKVLDPSVWQMIKNKSLQGFSVEGLFAERSVFSKEDKQINEIVNLLNQITDYE
jgi:Putative phage serine protease XkdF